MPQISIAASVEAPQQALEGVIKTLHRLYGVEAVEYGRKDKVSWVKCRLKRNNHETLTKLMELAALDANRQIYDIYDWSCKKMPVVIARSTVCYLLRRMLGLSYPKIAELMQAKQHTVILLACRKFSSLEGVVLPSQIIPAYVEVKSHYRKGS